MKYDFDQHIAKRVGVEEAILYSNICWWCAKNQADKSTTHFKDGRFWTYSSERAWAELFPFWTAKQISRMIRNLEKEGLIISAIHGGSDRTKWFSPLIQTVQCIDPNGLMQETKRANVYKEQIITSNNNPDNNLISKEITTEVVTEESEVVAYGNKKINEMLFSLVKSVGCTTFKESNEFQRNFGKHLVGLYEKIGKEEFMIRLKGVLSDPFKRKNSNSIKYLYGELKSYIREGEGVKLKEDENRPKSYSF